MDPHLSHRSSTILSEFSEFSWAVRTGPWLGHFPTGSDGGPALASLETRDKILHPLVFICPRQEQKGSKKTGLDGYSIAYSSGWDGVFRREYFIYNVPRVCSVSTE